MKIKALRADVNLRYKLRPSELEAAADNLRTYHRKAKRHNWFDMPEITGLRRKISLQRDGVVHRTDENRKELKAPRYVAVIEYSPATELSWWLMEHDFHALKHTTDLPFRDHSGDVLPSGLRQFKGSWSYGTGSRRLKKGDEPENDYRVGIEIMGFLDDKQQIRELREMVDALYLPVKTGDYFWETKTGGGGQGGSHPTIVLARNFTGDITPEAEKQVAEFYKSVLEFVLRYEVTEGFRFEDGGKTWAELEKEHSGLDMHEHIAASNAGSNGFYAPHLRIDAHQPHGKVHPELRYNNGKYRREKTIDLICLTTFAQTVFPQERRTSK